jgi:hypothetical protein
MKSINPRFSMLLIMACALVVACTPQASLPLDPTADLVKTAPAPTVTPADTVASLTTPITTSALPPALAEVSATPIAFLCPGDGRPEEEWQCRENSEAGTRHCTAVDPSQNLRCYEDLDYAFALTLPLNWSASVSEQQRPPFTPGTAVKTHRFLGQQGETVLDVFQAGAQDLTDWLADRRRLSPLLFPETELNAIVAGRPAVVWVECPQGYHSMAALAVGAGEHVYWWRYFAYSDVGMLSLHEMWNSFRFSSETVAPVEIPERIWQEALFGCSQTSAPTARDLYLSQAFKFSFEIPKN